MDIYGRKPCRIPTGSEKEKSAAQKIDSRTTAGKSCLGGRIFWSVKQRALGESCKESKKAQCKRARKILLSARFDSSFAFSRRGARRGRATKGEAVNQEWTISDGGKRK